MAENLVTFGIKMKIRKGTEKDLKQALTLVKELAAFEKAPDEVDVTVKEMKNWGFGKNKVFDFFVRRDHP